MTITLKITDAIELLDLVSKRNLTDDDMTGKTLISILKLNLFIAKKIESGSNTVALVPSLRKKLDELWFIYLEELENSLNKGIINEGSYLELSTDSLKERADTLELLDMLELGLVIKCIII